jgi:hypothetical protein
MFRYVRLLVLFVIIAGGSVCRADNGTKSLAEAVKAINEQAKKLPECRQQSPLTEDEVLKTITDFSRPKPVANKALQEINELSDKELQKLKGIVETRRLPKDVLLRQFVRYNDGADVEHGRWVRLFLMRENKCPFCLTVRQTSILRRPYNQKERQFQADIRRTGSIPTLGRLVTYFDEDPKFAAVQKFTAQEADRLAEAVKKAITDGNAEELLKTYNWDNTDAATVTSVGQEAGQLVKRKLSTVSVQPRRFGGRLTNWWGFQIWDPNIPVLGYIVLEFKDNVEPKSIELEFGHTESGARLVNYYISRDDRPGMIGKPLPGGGARVSGFAAINPEHGWDDAYDQIDASDELPALQNANLEIRKIKLK